MVRTALEEHDSSMAFLLLAFLVFVFPVSPCFSSTLHIDKVQGTALAATWDTALIRDGGALQASEAIAKGASVILGPTTNMQRSPLGGRGFESFSEDPFLAGAMTAATV